MNVKFLNPFVEAAHDVLSAEAGITPVRGTVSLQQSALTADEVTVLISLVGQVQGVVLYGLSVEVGLLLVSRMMSQTFESFDNLAQSGVAELGNVITGRASVRLAEAGYVSTISPPTLIQGKEIRISIFDFSRIVVPLRCDTGEITVHLALRENHSREHGTSHVQSVPHRVMPSRRQESS
jgi:chemotaxis protein CheX